jgi:hypothetical protein
MVEQVFSFCVKITIMYEYGKIAFLLCLEIFLQDT